MNLFDNDSLPNDESPQGKKSNGQVETKLHRKMSNFLFFVAQRLLSNQFVGIAKQKFGHVHRLLIMFLEHHRDTFEFVESQRLSR